MSVKEAFHKLNLNKENVSEETIRILIKIADNILNNPNNTKVRSLQKNNPTIKNKILATNGGFECLKLMGFHETSSGFILPSDSPLKMITEMKSALESFKTSESPIKVEKTMEMENEEISDDLKDVKRFVFPPLESKFSNLFLRRIQTQFHSMLAFADRSTQKRAKALIPLASLEELAQKNLRIVQEKMKKEKLFDIEVSVQDMLLLELLTWFKESFFTWVDNPTCEYCAGETKMSHMSTDPNDLIFANRVEVHKCPLCSKLTKFPRYEDFNILFETRKGRCGEWARVFTLLCLSLGWDARFVMDETDHVWTEVFSITQQKWIHCDVCENVCDTPLMYENGWNKKISYCIAYSPDELQDVTWRYSSDHKKVLKARKNCTESELIDALLILRKERQASMSIAKQNYLTKRLVKELADLMVENVAKSSDNFGRISGSKEWRVARGEVKSENSLFWLINDKQIINNKLVIKYSAALNQYQFCKGNNQVSCVNEWASGVFYYENIFRKEEKDWKTVYLSRTEGASTGRISWKFQLESASKRQIDKVSLNFSHQIFESGHISIKLSSNELSLELPKSGTITTDFFANCQDLTIEAVLSGGNGDTAWQHAQLFRQSTNSEEFPFVISFSFK